MTHRACELFLLTAIFGCETSPPVGPYDPLQEIVSPDVFDGRVDVIQSWSGKMSDPTVHEGLPHPFADEKFKPEKQRSDVFEFAGYSFYQPAIPLPENDLTEIRSLLSNRQSYARWRGEKLCDGFHPDWSID
jgi:hypothetical protein